MSEAESQTRADAASGGVQPSERDASVREVAEQIIEIVSDSGEGAQTAGQLFGTTCAKMGNGVWTVEIIPAEIEPPPRSREGASGIRVRFGTEPMTNMGDHADVVIAFNEQACYSRIEQGGLHPGTVMLLENKWASDPDPHIQEAYAEALVDFQERGYEVREVGMEEETLKITDNPRRGKNMWVVGMLCALYSRDLAPVETEVRHIFERRRKGEAVVVMNHKLLRAGYAWGMENLEERFHVLSRPPEQEMVVMNGNAAAAMGCMAAGIEMLSMYPITPATSATHYLAGIFQNAGGFVHQAEDEIAAVGFAIGASYAGKTAATITSGPGMALKTEFLGFAVMVELPLVVLDVQRGGPATGLPTKVEQGDLLSSMFGMPGDAPKVVMAPSTIEECFSMIITARKLAEAFSTLVIVLSDANLGTGQCPFPYPELSEDWLAPPVDQSPWDKDVRPYEWDPETGLSKRPVPGQRDGMFVLTGLAHHEKSGIAYDSTSNQRGMTMRSRKLAALQKTLKPPKVNGDEEGDLLVVGWGSTRGSLEEAVARVRADGHRVSSLHLRFLSPFEPGLKQIFSRFKRVMTIEINYSDDMGDPLIDEDSRRYSQLALLLRAHTLVDIDCWSRVPGQPVPPHMMETAIRARLEGDK
jgi:2-oxoglutarate ferredoxin oxidoreductase subunit alpha